MFEEFSKACEDFMLFVICFGVSLIGYIFGIPELLKIIFGV